MFKESQACGKCILFGEHSILHGGTAISLPLKKLRLKIRFEEDSNSQLVLANSEKFPNAEEIFWKLLENDFSDINWRGRYEIESQIPLGAGLGSSAALSVALHKLHRPRLAQHELIERAWQSEKLFHGKSSGIDPTTIALEDALCFRKPGDYETLSSEILQSSQYAFVLVDTGIRRSAKSGIQEGTSLKETNPALWRDTLHKLQSIAHKGRELFESCEVPSLGKLMNEAHILLRSWGLSHPDLEKMRDQLIEWGAIGAKLTGAGKGGFLISLFERSRLSALESRESAGIGLLDLGRL